MDSVLSGQKSIAQPRLWHQVVRRVLGIVGVIALGVLLGTLIAGENSKNTTAMVCMLVWLVIILYNPRWGVLVGLTLYPFIGDYVSIQLGAGLPDLSLTRFCVLTLLLMLLAQIALQLRPMFRITKVDWTALAFFLGLGVSTLASSHPIDAFRLATDRYFMPLLVYIIARNLFTTRQDVEQLIGALLILGFYSAIYIIYEQVTGNVLFTSKEYSQAELNYGYGIRIVKGLLGGPHVFGLVFTMSLPFAIKRFLDACQLYKKGLYIGLTLLLFVGIFLTFKRGIWLSAVGSLLLIQFFYPDFRRFFYVLLIVVAISIPLFGDSIASSSVADRFGHRLDTANGRTLIWEDAIALWKKSPIVGHGFGEFSHLSRFTATENMYLSFLVSAGLIGMFPFVLLIVFVVQDTVKIYKQSKAKLSPHLFVDWRMAATFSGAAISYLIKAFSGDMAVPLPNILFFLLIGAVIEAPVSLLSQAQESTACPSAINTIIAHTKGSQ